MLLFGLADPSVTSSMHSRLVFRFPTSDSKESTLMEAHLAQAGIINEGGSDLNRVRYRSECGLSHFRFRGEVRREPVA